jgi:hypothetical protein
MLIGFRFAAQIMEYSFTVRSSKINEKNLDIFFSFIYMPIHILLDIFHATPQSPQRLIPIALDNQRVASMAALRETKMSSRTAYPSPRRSSPNRISRFDSIRLRYLAPFSDKVSLRFELDSPATVQAFIHDLHGKIVKQFSLTKQEAGTHSLQWSSEGVAPGPYIYRIIVDGQLSSVFLHLAK